MLAQVHSHRVQLRTSRRDTPQLHSSPSGASGAAPRRRALAAAQRANIAGHSSSRGRHQNRLSRPAMVLSICVGREERPALLRQGAAAPRPQVEDQDERPPLPPSLVLLQRLRPGLLPPSLPLGYLGLKERREWEVLTPGASLSSSVHGPHVATLRSAQATTLTEQNTQVALRHETVLVPGNSSDGDGAPSVHRRVRRQS